MPSKLKGRDIVVMGASAGGFSAVMEVVRALPLDLRAALFLVIHTSPDNPGILPTLLGRAGPLSATLAYDGEPIRHGHIYVAPPDHHLLLKPEHVHVVRGPQENGFRPAVDPLFRSAAAVFGPRVTAVVLSGGLDDGTYGLMLVKRAGGVTVAQDPDEALVDSMPRSAIENADVDYVLKAAEIAPMIVRFATEAVPVANRHAGRGKRSRPDITEVGSTMEARGACPSKYTCPQCGGTLWMDGERPLLRFRCHEGHAYSGDGLLTHQAEKLEDALWTALRILEEHADLRRRMAGHAATRHSSSLSRRFELQAHGCEQRAQLIREVLLGHVPAGAKRIARETHRKAVRPRKGRPRKA